MERVVAFAREHEIVSCTTSPTPISPSTATEPPSILQVPRRRRRRGRALHADEVVLDGRLARRVPRRQRARSCRRWRGSKCWLDYGTFQPIQIAAITAMNEAPGDPPEVCGDLPLAAGHALRRARPRGLGVPPPAGNDVRLGAGARAVRASSALSPSRSSSRARPGSRSLPGGLRPGRRGLRPLRARRERAPHPPGRPRHRRVLERPPPSSRRSRTTSPTTTSAGHGRSPRPSASSSRVAIIPAGRGACRVETTAAGVAGGQPCGDETVGQRRRRPSPMKSTIVPPAATSAS